MNKNPFVPQTNYQPPLPPGPPPSQPQDYSVYWAASAAQHTQAPQAPQSASAYTPQWTAPQPPPPSQPPPEQSALFANYGYGNYGGQSHWRPHQQHQQQHQQQQYQHPLPIAQPPPQPPPHHAYTPYQSYGQPYVPTMPQPIPVPSYPHSVPQQPQAQQYYPPPSQPRLQQPPPRHNIQPPAKRQRFNEPAYHNYSQQRPPPPTPPPPPHHNPPPPPPLHHPPSGPPLQNSMLMGPSGGRGGPPPSRGGSVGRGGRGGGALMNSNRGGIGGRGGSNFSGGRGGRGGPSGGPMRSHGSRGGFGNKDHSHRRGGSFGTPTGGGGGPGHSHQQQNTSFRGRNQGHMRTGRQDAGSSLGARDGPMNSSFGNTGKKDENRRTFTDFKFVGLEFPDFHWSWGTLPVQETPPPSPVKTETDDAADALDAPRDNVKAEPTELDLSDARSGAEAAPHSSVKDENYTSASEAVSSRQLKAVPTELVIAPSSSDSPAGSFNTPPPSRLRIYFHTPVSLDDSRPIPNSLSTASVIGPAPSDSRKGKRKKLEDEECDQEEGRARPPPPQMGGAVGDDHSSVTPSVDVDEAERASIAPSAAESASEGDWLMAAIAADEAGGDADNQTDLGDNDVPHESEVPTSHDGGPCAAEKDGHEEPAGEWFDSAVNGIARVEDSSPAGGNAASCGIEPVHTADFGSIQGSHDPIVGLIAPADGSELPVASEVAVPDASEVGQVEGAPVSEVALAADASVTQVGDASSSDSGVPSAPLDDEHGSQTEKVADEVLPPVSEPSAAEIAPSEATAPELGPVAAGEVLSADLVEQVVVVGGAVENGSILPTVPGDAPEEPPSSSEDAVPVVKSETADIPIVNGHSTDSTPPREAAPSESGKQGEEDPLPVSSSSPVPKALLSATASVSGTTETSPVKKEPKEAKSASANRLSISYAGGNRRLVVDAEVIDTLTVFRSEGRIEVVMKVNKGEGTGFKGIYVEGLSDVTKSYLPLQLLPDYSEDDSTVPPFPETDLPVSVTMIVHLNRDRPLSEPKWVKTGDVQEWLKSLLGRMFWVAGDAAEDGWEKKIEVKDPDPAPTIWTILDGWVVNSNVGQQGERQRFLKTQMSEPDNILEILLRLVRGEQRASQYSQSSSASSASNASGPLLSALARNSPHGGQQSPVSLAVLAMFRMTAEYALKAVGEKGQSEVEERLGDIVRCLPPAMINKSMDGMFKEWKMERKGGR